MSRPSLFADLEKAMARVHEIFGEMGNCYENGTPIDPDLNTELREVLGTLHPRIVAALERYGHSDRARELRNDWEAIPIERRFVPQPHRYDIDIFVDCPAYNVLAGAIEVLKDAFGHYEAELAREEHNKSEEALRQEARDSSAHKRTFEIRTFEANEGHKARRWQLWLALMTAAVSLLIGLGGNADKFATLIGRSPPPAPALVTEGGLETADRSAIPADLEIDCGPHVLGVTTAVGDGTWSLTVLPSAARPLKLYCRGVSKSTTSESVAVRVPAGPNALLEPLPKMLLRRPPQPPTPPTAAPPATGSH